MIFISPSYNRLKKLGGFSRYVPLSVPIGIGWLAGALMDAGKKVKILDEEVVGPCDDLLEEYVKDLEKPYIFGVSCMTASIKRGQQIAAVIKEKFPDSKVVFGGIHPTVLPEEALQNPNVDVAIRGEAEETIPVLYDRLKNNQDFSDIKGLSFRRNGQFVHNPPAPLPDVTRLSKFPYFLFEQHSSAYELGFITSSRGCPYDCSFCSQRSISGRKYRFFPAEIVTETLDDIVNKYHRNYVTFLDDAFSTNKQRVIDLCREIQKRGLHKKALFDCQARGDAVDEEVLAVMRESGFRVINFGIETASERLMKLINKGETVEDIKKGVALAKKFGFKISGTFILGLPTETRQERAAAYRLAKEMDLDYVRFNNATPYPGTRLYQTAIEEGRLNPGKDWENLNACGTLVESPFREAPLAYVPLGASELALRCDILKYNLFYSFRPKSILKILKERVGPAGWLALPPQWYLKPAEWFYLGSFALKVAALFIKVFIYSLLTLFEKR